MDLSTLRGDIQKIVSVNAGSNPLTIDLALGLIGAYVLQKEDKKISDWDAMNTFLAYLRSECFKGTKKAIITDSSFSDCVLHIQHYMSTMPFEKKKGTLMSLGLKVITGAEENGYLSFNDKTFVAYATQTIINGKPAQDYVVDVRVDETNYEETSADVVIAKEEPIKDQEKEYSGTIDILVAEKKQKTLNACSENSPFILMYDKLVNEDRGKRTEAKYTWQWLLSLDEYNAIKDCIGKNKIPSPKNWDYKTARLLTLYIGEFYKREYENNLTPFTQLDENSLNFRFIQYSKLCETLKIESYKKENRAHLYTLYVNGGLPVHYISTKLDNDKSNAFIDGLSKLFDAEDGLDIEEGEDLLEKVNNTALRESYHNHHSIYDYVQALLKGERVWHDSDNDHADFRDLKEKIREASKRANERKKFKMFYSLWMCLDNSTIKEFYLTPQLRFNPEEDGDRHYAISKQRLANWGINNPPAQFALKICDNDLVFSFCCNGDYISRDLVDRIDLPNLDDKIQEEDLFNPDYDIVYDDLAGESYSLKKDFYFPFKDGFLQFYTDDDPSMALWNSYKGAQSFLWSGLLYNKNRYQLRSPIPAIEINEHFAWVRFADSVILEDTYKSKIRSFVNSKGRIYAKPKEQSLHKELIDNPCLLDGCILDGMTECTIGSINTHAYIVYSLDIAFDVFSVANDEKVWVTPTIEYKSATDYIKPSNAWNKYNSAEELSQGLYVFRLSFGRYTTEVYCYLLPRKANISFYNTSEPYLIKFNGFLNVESKEIVRNNQGDFSIPANDNRDKYIFFIGDDDRHITLKTYHPKAQFHLYLHGQEIKDKPIIMAYAEDIEVNYISAQKCGKRRLSDYAAAYKRLWGALTDINNATQLIQGHDIKLVEDDSNSQSTITVRVYTQDFQIERGCPNNMMLLDFSTNQLVQYGQDLKIEHDSLLFQSLKNVDYTGVYYAPKYMHLDGQNLVNRVMAELRINRLSKYVTDNQYISDRAYQQFEIACEYKIYFAVFDSLLCLCWDGRNQVYLDRNKKKFKDNILAFLKGYVSYIENNMKEPCIAGLKRLASEFLFDWESIKKEIDKSDSQQLKELYQEIINN